MYQVALCEDEEIFYEALEKDCGSILNKLNTEYCITVFDNSADFLKAFSEEQKRYDLILFDIIMDKIDGMELARIVRESDREAAIIFITSSREHVLQGYDVKALHYLMKPVDIGKLEQLIKEAYHQKFQNDFLVFKSGAQMLRISIQDIIVLEIVGRRVEITLPDRTIYYSGKLTELLSQLPEEQFVRCHQAFAVNISKIREITRRSAISTDGKEIPVSRTYMKDVQKVFLRACLTSF